MENYETLSQAITALKQQVKRKLSRMHCRKERPATPRV